MVRAASTAAGEAVPQTNARVETANALFGGGQPDRAGAAPSGVAVRLLGVVAAQVTCRVMR